MLLYSQHPTSGHVYGSPVADCYRICPAGNAIRAHQDLAAAQEQEGGKNGLLTADNEKLQNVYFSYQSLEEEYGMQKAGTTAAAGRPGTATKGRPGSALKGTGAAGLRSSKDPTNIGNLRDSVAWGQVGF